MKRSSQTDVDDALVDQLWETLVETLIRHKDVARGKMMTADALTCGGKVFVFRSRRNGTGLGCKLGKDSSPDDFGIDENWWPLQPFANRAPMGGWYVIGAQARVHWLHLAQVSLRKAREWLANA